MAALPHDITDLRLAPVVLAVDAAIEKLGRLSVDELADQIERYRVVSQVTPEARRQWLLQELESGVDTFEWRLSSDERGIRLTHKEHTLVLGIPPTFTAYVEGGPSADG
jgi:hypothetical protein